MACSQINIWNRQTVKFCNDWANFAGFSIYIRPTFKFTNQLGAFPRLWDRPFVQNDEKILVLKFPWRSYHRRYGWDSYQDGPMSGVSPRPLSASNISEAAPVSESNYYICVPATVTAEQSFISGRTYCESKRSNLAPREWIKIIWFMTTLVLFETNSCSVCYLTIFWFSFDLRK